MSSSSPMAHPAELLVLSGACAGDVHRFTGSVRIGSDASCEPL